MPRQWKENPPGEEQKLLERLFREGSIDDSDTPSKVYQKYPDFKDFSERVFSSHFRSTKAKLGLFARVNGNGRNCDDEFDDPGTIAELGAIGPVASTSTSRTTRSVEPVGIDVGIQYQNAPYFTWVYTDHTKMCDFVCVAVPIISGSRDINFNLSDDGNTVFVNYVWPAALYTPQELFKNLLNGEKAITMDHPRLHAFASRLLECDVTQKSRPQGIIKIALPVKVQREIGTFTKSAVKSNDAKIILLEFRAYQKKQIINDCDTFINFD